MVVLGLLMNQFGFDTAVEEDYGKASLYELREESNLQYFTLNSVTKIQFLQNISNYTCVLPDIQCNT